MAADTIVLHPHYYRDNNEVAEFIVLQQAVIAVSLEAIETCRACE
jgi:hypothetical protein